MTEVRDNTERSRYELIVDDEVVGFADYTRRGTTVVVPHTQIEPALRGRGLGAQLVRGTLDLVRADGALVDPACPFVADFIDAHPEYQDLVAPI
jgi:predicted GNAT family acetyltransferase